MQTEHYLTLAGFLITFVLFYIGQRNQLKALEKQIQTQSEENTIQHLHSFQNSFWQKQLELYIETSIAAAELTEFAINSTAYEASRTKFYTQFWGPMSIVEDKSVKDAMQEFSKQLHDYENNPTESALKELKRHSYLLSKTCRDSSIKRWELEDFKIDSEKS